MSGVAVPRTITSYQGEQIAPCDGHGLPGGVVEPCDGSCER